MKKKLEQSPDHDPSDGDTSQRPIEEFVEFEFENEEVVSTETTFIKDQQVKNKTFAQLKQLKNDLFNFNTEFKLTDKFGQIRAKYKSMYTSSQKIVKEEINEEN
jgi:hypothetical protein